VTATRRLTAIEQRLQPLEIVLGVIAEAQAFPSIEAYARAVADQPVEASPISRIAADVEASVRSTMRGRLAAEVAAAVRREVGDAVFRYILFLKLNEAALELADREGLRATAVFYWMGCLLGAPDEDDLSPEDWVAHRMELDTAWSSWRAVVASLDDLVAVEDAARETVEDQFLGGLPSLLGDAAGAWDRFAAQVEHLASVATVLATRADSEESGVILGDRVAERARRLTDDARVATFERIGEMLRAVAIIERRLVG
jgi:hypothetical protein